MSKHACFVAVAVLSAAQLPSPPVLAAAPLDFDCDVPADHFSSVSQEAIGPLMIKGSVIAIQMRSGENLPLAGVRITSSDGADSVGFRVIASSPRAKQLDIKLNTKQGSDLKEATEGQVDARAEVPFSFSLSDSGEVTLTIGGSIFKTNFMPIAHAKAMAFCSTGQFKFKDLILPDGESPANSARP